MTPVPSTGRPLVLLITASLMAFGVVAGAQETPTERLEGEPIVRIVFDRFNVFDTSQPELDKWFYRAANSLHIISKESFLRSMLLFEEGDPFSQHDAEESARILRELGFINPVFITATPVEGGVEVHVETHDQWTLEVGATAGVFGNRQAWGIEFQETNFLGRGKKLDVEYDSDVERDSLSFGYFDPNIRGTRWRAELRYADLSDGFLEKVKVDRPFYSLATRRAWGGLWQRGELTQYLYSLADPVVSGPGRSTQAQIWYGLRTLSSDGGTLPLPVPAEMVTSSTADVGGTEATVLTSRNGLFAGVVWVEDGVMTGVAGTLSADELLAVARDLR